MLSEARLKYLKKKIILGPKTAILGPQLVEFWCWGHIFGVKGDLGPPGAIMQNNELNRIIRAWENNHKHICREQIESGDDIGSAFAVYHQGELVVNLVGGYADTEAQRP